MSLKFVQLKDKIHFAFSKFGSNQGSTYLINVATYKLSLVSPNLIPYLQNKVAGICFIDSFQ